MHIAELCEALGPLAKTLRLSQLIAFIVIGHRIKQDILLIQSSSQPPSEPPLVLDPEAMKFLSLCCDLNIQDQSEVITCWRTLKHILWNPCDVLESVLSAPALVKTFRENGGVTYPSPISIYPPTLMCIYPECQYVQEQKPLKLQEIDKQRNGVLYTMGSGPIPVNYHHLRCSKCQTVYHPDFYVPPHPKDTPSARMYYAYAQINDTRPEVNYGFLTNLPVYIQVSDHRFIETTLIRQWRNTMQKANTSATSCASVYNKTWSQSVLPTNWTIQQIGLRTEHVFDGFTVLSLLEEFGKAEQQLKVPHSGSQAFRFDGAMQEVNDRIRLNGVDEIHHRCDKCVRVIKEPGQPKKEITAVICDGVTLGRPTCRVAHCREPLRSTRDHYCQTHRELGLQCGVVGCTARARQGHKSCNNPEHIAAEELFNEVNSAAFQCTRRQFRYERDHQSGEEQQEGEEPLRNTEYSSQEFEAEVEVQNAGTGVQFKVVKAAFHRARTHNQQLIFSSCGVILGQDTFPFSEGVSQVALFVFDNNCILLRYVTNPASPPHIQQFFHPSRMGMPVDVFHFKSKHKSSDNYCGQHCNPINFPELTYHDANGKLKWWFNTSIAEEKNSWIGRYAPMVREMHSVFFDFFLNTMVRLHNEDLVEQLERQGMNPRRWRVISPPTTPPVSTWQPPPTPPILKTLEQQVEAYGELCEKVHRGTLDLEVRLGLALPEASSLVIAAQTITNKKRSRSRTHSTAAASRTPKRQRTHTAPIPAKYYSVSNNLESQSQECNSESEEEEEQVAALISFDLFGSTIGPNDSVRLEYAEYLQLKEAKENGEHDDLLFGGSHLHWCSGEKDDSDYEGDAAQFSDSLLGELALEDL
ncbi:hypothetical protein VNI00_016687 [Paramarasmius palmivorus]|uniref:CxC5 like cysteine cluster associated with KDZ domain-containing protein n=1 Tax=Paramarasmius palmivorus TaxID=297713 RepID=A0AAW0BCL5_9AGAR